MFYGPNQLYVSNLSLSKLILFRIREEGQKKIFRYTKERAIYIIKFKLYFSLIHNYNSKLQTPGGPDRSFVVT